MSSNSGIHLSDAQVDSLAQTLSRFLNKHGSSNAFSLANFIADWLEHITPMQFLDEATDSN
jgi:hypothetical protein